MSQNEADTAPVKELVPRYSTRYPPVSLDRQLPHDLKENIASRNVSEEAVVTARDVVSLRSSMAFREEGLDRLIADLLRLPQAETDLRAWQTLLNERMPLVICHDRRRRQIR